jgi:integrase
VVDSVDVPKNARNEMRILTVDEINLVMKEAHSTPYYALFMTALMTGMRRSELLGLGGLILI